MNYLQHRVSSCLHSSAAPRTGSVQPSKHTTSTHPGRPAGTRAGRCPGWAQATRDLSQPSPLRHSDGPLSPRRHRDGERGLAGCAGRCQLQNRGEQSSPEQLPAASQQPHREYFSLLFFFPHLLPSLAPAMLLCCRQPRGCRWSSVQGPHRQRSPHTSSSRGKSCKHDRHHTAPSSGILDTACPIPVTQHPSPAAARGLHGSQGSCTSPGHSSKEIPRTGILGCPAANIPSPGGATNVPAVLCLLLRLGLGGNWQNWGRKRGGKQRALDKSEKKQHTKGGRRKAELELDPALLAELELDPVLLGGVPRLRSRRLDRILPASGNTSGGSWPLRPRSAHPTCARRLPGSPLPPSRFHSSVRCLGFASVWKSPELHPCAPEASYRLGDPRRDGELGLCVPGSPETDPLVTINLWLFLVRDGNSSPRLSRSLLPHRSTSGRLGPCRYFWWRRRITVQQFLSSPLKMTWKHLQDKASKKKKPMTFGTESQQNPALQPPLLLEPRWGRQKPPPHPLPLLPSPL